MKLNKQQTDQITGLAEQFDSSKDIVTKQFNVILGDKKIQSLDEKSRPKAAMRMLRAQLNAGKDKASFGGTPVDVVLRVELKEEPTEFRRKDGKKGYRSSVYCTANTGDGDFFAVMTLWNDANELNPQMVVGETYATKAIRKDNALAMNKVEELTSVEDKLAPMSDVITDSYPIVDVENLELNISDDYNDLKLIKGVITGAWSTMTKNDSMMGFLKLISEETDDTVVAKFSRIYEQVDLWDDGSLVYVLGQITPATYDEDSGELQYEASVWGNLIVPIEAFEKEVEEPEPEKPIDVVRVDARQASVIS